MDTGTWLVVLITVAVFSGLAGGLIVYRLLQTKPGDPQP